MQIQGAPQVMRHPLGDAGREVFLAIRTDRVEGGYHQDGGTGKFQDCNPVVTGGGQDKPVQPAVYRPGLENVVEYDFQRPGLKQVGNTFAYDREKPEPERERVRLQQLSYR